MLQKQYFLRWRCKTWELEATDYSLSLVEIEKDLFSLRKNQQNKKQNDIVPKRSCLLEVYMIEWLCTSFLLKGSLLLHQLYICSLQENIGIFWFKVGQISPNYSQTIISFLVEPWLTEY